MKFSYKTTRNESINTKAIHKVITHLKSNNLTELKFNFLPVNLNKEELKDETVEELLNELIKLETQGITNLTSLLICYDHSFTRERGTDLEEKFITLLKQHTDLTHFKLEHSELIMGKKTLKNLTHLDLRCSHLCTEQTKDLADTIESLKKLTHLGLIDSISEEQLIKLLATLKGNNTLTHLDLSSNKIGSLGAKHIADFLEVNNTLTHLDLSYNDIGNFWHKELFTVLEVNNTLTHLDLSNNNIGSLGENQIADFLKANNTLTHLNLSCNKIGNLGEKYIADSLKVNNTLTHLDLSHNDIGSHGYNGIVAALEVNKILTHLDLNHNKIGNLEEKHLADFLKENKALTHLNLSHNRIRRLGEKEIANFLKENNTLTHLDLSHGNIKSLSDNGLLAALKVNNTLTHLDLQYNKIEKNMLQKLEVVLKANSTLTELNLEDENMDRATQEEFMDAKKINTKHESVLFNIVKIPSKEVHNNPEKSDEQKSENFLNFYDDFDFNESFLIEDPKTDEKISNISDSQKGEGDPKSEQLGGLVHLKKQKKSSDKEDKKNNHSTHEKVELTYFLNSKYTKITSTRYSENETESLEERLKMNTLEFKEFKARESDNTTLNTLQTETVIEGYLKIISQTPLKELLNSVGKIYFILAGRILKNEVKLPPQRKNDLTFLIITAQEYEDLKLKLPTILNGLIGESEKQNIALSVYNGDPGIVSRRGVGLRLMSYLNSNYEKKKFFSLDDNIKFIAINTNQVTNGMSTTEKAFHELIDVITKKINTTSLGTIFSLSGLDYRKNNTITSHAVGSKFTYFKIDENSINYLLGAYSFFPLNFAQQDYFIHYALTKKCGFNTSGINTSEISWKRDVSKNVNNMNQSSEAKHFNLKFEESYLDETLVNEIFNNIYNSNISNEQKKTYKSLYSNFIHLMKTEFEKLSQKENTDKEIGTYQPNKKQKTGDIGYDSNKILNAQNINKQYHPKNNNDSSTKQNYSYMFNNDHKTVSLNPKTTDRGGKKDQQPTVKEILTKEEYEAFNALVNYHFKNNNAKKIKGVNIEGLQKITDDHGVLVKTYITELSTENFENFRGVTFKETTCNEPKKSIDILVHRYENKPMLKDLRVSSIQPIISSSSK
jgi:Ran GTPase-activating protein (RanGAP) involved in mRNA processing and transport